MNITELETEVLRIISFGDEYNEMPCECFENIMYDFNGSRNQLKGVLGSLEKKGLIEIGEYSNGLNAYFLLS